MSDSCTFVIFGATGNLARNKLLPALYHLQESNRLPDGMSIVCMGRKEYSREQWQAYVRELLQTRARGSLKEEVFALLAERLHYRSGDLRKQQYTRSVLQRQHKFGFAEFAAGTEDLDSCVYQDNEVENLYHMGSGISIPKPLELLSSNKFATMLDTLREHFDHIIIDSAPLLPVSDSLVLGHLVDEVLLVIKADKTTHAMAKESVKRLSTAHVVPLGVVLQQADLKKLDDYGSQYYSYGYGYE